MSAALPIELEPTFACWLWRGKMSNDGYPIIWRGKRPTGAHREVYTRELGAIADGLVLDHLCRRPLCVAPHHLEPVTRSENELRKSFRYRSRRARCKRGHDLRITGAITPEGGKVCRDCNREARTP